MSTVYYFICRECKSSQESGKNGYLWTGPLAPVKERDDWLMAHEGHSISYFAEHNLPEWVYVEWRKEVALPANPFAAMLNRKPGPDGTTPC